jgi:hypothetical protein
MHDLHGCLCQTSAFRGQIHDPIKFSIWFRGSEIIALDFQALSPGTSEVLIMILHDDYLNIFQCFLDAVPNAVNYHEDASVPAAHGSPWKRYLVPGCV